MGLSYSSAQNIYLNEYNNPLCEERYVKKLVTMHPSSKLSHFISPKTKETFATPCSNLVSDKDQDERAVILSISVEYIQNLLKHDVVLTLSNLFERIVKEGNEDVPYPDDTGNISILCPAGIDREMKGSEKLLYKPRLSVDLIKMYAGVGESIINLGPDAKAFKQDHPLVYYLINNQEQLDIQPGDVLEKEEIGVYVMKPEFVQKTKTLFQNTIYDNIHYTRFEDTRLTCPMNKEIFHDMADETEFGGVSIVLMFHYLLIRPGELKMKHVRTQLK